MTYLELYKSIKEKYDLTIGGSGGYFSVPDHMFKKNKMHNTRTNTRELTKGELRALFSSFEWKYPDLYDAYHADKSPISSRKLLARAFPDRYYYGKPVRHGNKVKI